MSAARISDTDLNQVNTLASQGRANVAWPSRLRQQQPEYTQSTAVANLPASTQFELDTFSYSTDLSRLRYCTASAT